MSTSIPLPEWLGTNCDRPAHAKIVATLGPASESPDVLERLIDAGASVFRLNFSHGGLEAQGVRLQNVRAAAERLGRPIAVFGDLQGPKIRVEQVPDLDPEGGIVVEAGQDVVFRTGHAEASIQDGVPTFTTTFDPITRDVEPGQRVLVNDGAIRMLAVDRAEGQWLRCRVTVGGRVTSRKGINLPESNISAPAIAEADWACVRWAVDNGLDYLALSFVRSAREVWSLKDRLRGMAMGGDDAGEGGIPVISKIEKPQALTNLEEIIEASDGVMVARGDLGVEMDAAQVPVAQKHIIARCRDWGKPVIVATQMLETMIEAHAPTRAEASDVANAVFDGTHAVMLSGETAVGKHPPLVVETMRRIVQVAEVHYDKLPARFPAPKKLPELAYRSAALAHGASQIARTIDAKLVCVWSQRAGMATYLSQHDVRAPIVACTTSRTSARRMCLLGGVIPVEMNVPGDGSLAAWTDAMEALILERNLAERGASVVLIAGKPLGSVDSQDTLAILRVGDPNSGFRPY